MLENVIENFDHPLVKIVKMIRFILKLVFICVYFTASKLADPLLWIKLKLKMKIRYDSKILKTIISIVPEIICPKILFLHWFFFRTLQEYFVFTEKKSEKCMSFSWFEISAVLRYCDCQFCVLMRVAT